MSIALESQPLSPWGAACARLPSTKPSKHRSQRRQGITAVLWTTLANARVGQRENRRFDPRRAAEHRATGISGFRHAPAIRSPARWRIAAKRRSRWTYARWVRMLCRHNGSDHVGRRSGRRGTGKSAGPVGVPFARSFVPVAQDHQHVHQGFPMPVITLADRHAGLGDYLTGQGTSPSWR